jgi:ankyrin repeat protein
MASAPGVQDLISAVRSNDVPRVEKILAARPELVHFDVSAGNEHRALHHAVLERLPEMVRLLMRFGADARKGIYPHRIATGPLTIARERDYDEIVAIIEEEEARRGPVAEPPKADPTPLEAAIKRGDVAWLRAHQAEASNQAGLLTLAVKENQPDVLAALLDFGLDPDERTTVGGLEERIESWSSPLWHAAVDGKLGMAEMLLARGADPNGNLYASGTPYFQAYCMGDPRMIDLLKRHGGRPSADIAGHNRLPDMTRGLMEAHGSDPAFIEQLLWSAACGGDPEIVRIALDRTDWPPGDKPWFRILEQPLYLWNHMPLFWQKPDWDRTTYFECFRLILERSGPDLTGSFGLTPLHAVAATRDYVSAEERVAFATLLLDADARFHVRDELLLSTPLGWACRWGRVELVRLLLDRGADAIEPDAELWAAPRASAHKMGHQQIEVMLA